MLTKILSVHSCDRTYEAAFTRGPIVRVLCHHRVTQLAYIVSIMIYSTAAHASGVSLMRIQVLRWRQDKPTSLALALSPDHSPRQPSSHNPHCNTCCASVLCGVCGW